MSRLRLQLSIEISRNQHKKLIGFSLKIQVRTWHNVDKSHIEKSTYNFSRGHLTECTK